MHTASSLFCVAIGLAASASLNVDAAPLAQRSPPRKILCLHGGGGTGESIEFGVSSLRSALGTNYEFVFPSAPDRLWMRDPPNGKGEPTTDPNWSSESFSILDRIVATQGPFYGILGYSQGAAFIPVYLSHAPEGTFQMAAMFAGYLPTTHVGLINTINAAKPFNSIPALVWSGGQDPIANGNLASPFTNPVVIHSAPAGHVVPSSSDSTFNQVIAFIRNPADAERPTGAPTTEDTDTGKTGGEDTDAGKGEADEKKPEATKAPATDGKGKGDWEQQQDGSWLNTATGETYGTKGLTDGKGNSDEKESTEKPAVTKPAATKAPATKPAATKPAMTKAPATKPAATKPTVTACGNDNTWRQARGKAGKVHKRRTCKWVAKKANKRCARKGLDGITAFAACAQACGTCPM